MKIDDRRNGEYKMLAGYGSGTIVETTDGTILFVIADSHGFCRYVNMSNNKDHYAIIEHGNNFKPDQIKAKLLNVRLVIED